MNLQTANMTGTFCGLCLSFFVRILDSVFLPAFFL